MQLRAALTAAAVAAVLLLAMPSAAIFIRSISPKRGSLAGGTTITIEGNDLMGNDTAGIDIYTGPLPCDILWYASNNNKVYCRTHPLYSATRETKLVYSNWLVATRTSCKDCFYEFNADNTPLVHRSLPVVSSRAKLAFGGELKGKFARQYQVDIGKDLGRCEGIMRKDAPQLQFGLNYEQEIAKSWTEDLDVTCYLPELEAGRYNYSLLVNHLAPGVIVSGDDEAGTKMFKGPDEGLGHARFGEELVTARGHDAKLFLVVPQTEELSTQISGKLGGHLLTIKGSGFDTADDCADNDVRLSGIACRVLSCTGSELTCVVGPANPHEYAPPAPHPSTHGLLATTHDGYDTQSRRASGVAMTTTTWHDPMEGHFDVPQQRYGVAAMKLQGYFVAPYSAYYSFYSHGPAPSYCALRLGTSHNETSAQQLSVCGESLLGERAKIYLDKGHRYYYEHSHRYSGGGVTDFRTAVRIHAPAHNAPWGKTDAEHQYHSWEEIQTVQLNPTFVNEEMELAITNVWGGAFKLHNPRYKRTSSLISLDNGPAAAAASLQVQMRKNHVMRHQVCGTSVQVKHAAGDPKVDGYIKFHLTYGCLPRSKGNEAAAFFSTSSLGLDTTNLISNKTSTTTTQTTTTDPNATNATGAGGNATNTFTPLVDTTNATSSWDAGPGFGLKLKLLVPGSKRLGGMFRLSLNGFDFTSSMVVGSSGDLVAYRMRMQLSVVRELKVQKTTSGHSVIYTFRFQSQGRNMPMIRVWDNDLTPRTNGAKVTVDVQAVTDGGGNDLYYDPIPADFFEQASSKPQSVVTVNGFTAECATDRDVSGPKYDKTFDPWYDSDATPEFVRECDGDPTRANCYFAYSTPDCSFEYNASYTPVVTAVTTPRAMNEAVADDEITIEGTGFLGANTVQIGGSPCTVTSENATRITCTITHMKAGQYHPVVVSSEVGQAEVAANVDKVVYQLVISKLEPLEGSVRGGGMLMINGTGFSNIAHENHIVVGGGACYPKAADFDHVLCYVPFSHLVSDLDTRCWGGAACVDLNGTAVATTTVGPGTETVGAAPRAVTITQSGAGFGWAMDSGSTTGVVGADRVASGQFNSGFPELTVYENDVVTFAGSPGATHHFAIKDTSTNNVVVGPTAKGAAFGGLEWTPAGLGGETFTYYCPPHSSVMFGTIVVKPGNAPGRRGRERRSTTELTDVSVQIFQYEDMVSASGVFEDDGRERAECLSSVLDGAWGAWSGEMEAVLRDTKYFGYSCKKCNKQIAIEHKRWGSQIEGEEYVRDEASASAGWQDGAWSQWQDSGSFKAYEGITTALSKTDSPYIRAGYPVDEACAADLAALQNAAADGAWSTWGNVGQWSAWTTEKDAFTYDWDLTPSITKINPAQFGSALTTRITVDGDFAAFRAQAGGCKASLRFVSPSGLFRECQQLVLNKDGNGASCVAVRGKSFPVDEQRKMFPRLELCTPAGQAVVAHPEPDCCSAAPFHGRVDMALRIDSTHPKSGSLAGGSRITIRGSGFSNPGDKIVRSALTYNYYDSMTVVNISTDHKSLPCRLLESNFSTVVCETTMLEAEEAEYHSMQYHGQYVYTGPKGRNGRIAVSVNDIEAEGCTKDADRKKFPARAAEMVVGKSVSSSLTRELNGTCEAASTDGGKWVRDYIYTYRNQSVDLELGVVAQVQARKNVYIALSPVNRVSSKSLHPDQDMYEIVLGGWGNTQSAIRKTKMGANQVVEGTPFALTGWAPKHYWFRVRNGTVKTLSGGNDGNARNLQACVGECDSDSQCAAGLTCFQRKNGEAIPGCTGPGAGKQWDYCHSPNGKGDGVVVEVGEGCTVGENIVMSYADWNPSFTPAYFGVATRDVEGDFVHCQSRSDLEMNGGCGRTTAWDTATQAPLVAATTATPDADVGDGVCGTQERPGKWKLLFRQTAPMFKPKLEWLTTNIDNPSDPNYSILAQLENYRGSDGLFELQMTWPRYTKAGLNWNVWKQSNNPVDVRVSGVKDYQPLDVSFTGAGWQGLEYHTGGSALLDGGSGWWYAIGTAYSYGSNGIPGPNGIVQTQVELRVCDESAITTPDAAAQATPAPTVLTYNDTTPDFTCEFDFAEAATPVFSSIFPRSGSGPTTVTIKGVNMGAVAPTVHVGMDVCEVVKFGEDADNSTHNVQEIQCTVPAMTAGWYHVKIHVPGRGYAAHPDAEEMIHAFESELSISSVEPAAGSWSGGMLVTVSGAGFSSRLRNNTVAVEVGNETRPAHVLRAEHGRLIVVMPSFEREDANGTFLLSANASSAEACVASSTVAGNTTINTTTCTPTAVSTAGLARAAKIVVAVAADLVQMEEFGQTSPIAHRYKQGTDPVGLVAAEMRRDFAKAAATYVAGGNGTSAGWVERTTHYAGTSECASSAACVFAYTDDATPAVTGVSPTKGSRGDVLTLTGTNLDLGGGSTYDVLIGDQACVVDAASVTATEAKCTVGATPAGKHAVYFTNAAAGTARVSIGVSFESQLKVTAVSHQRGGFGGGQLINISGSGFGGGTARTERRRRDGAWGGWVIYEYLKVEEAAVNLGASVTICNQECTVVSSNYNSVQCYTPEVKTAESLKLTDMYEAELLTGALISDASATASEDTFTRAAAFDRIFDRAFVSAVPDTDEKSRCFTGYDFGAGAAAVVEKVRWFPVHQQRHKTVGALFQGSNDGAQWTTIHTVAASTEAWNFAAISGFAGQSFRYLRYAGPEGSDCLVAELEFLGQVVSPSDTCEIMIGTQAPLSHPSLGPSETDYEVEAEYKSGISYTYSASHTPVVEDVWPPHGSSLGGDELTITGKGLPTSAGSASVLINGRDCVVKSAAASGTEVKCTTTQRTDFRPLSVKVRSTESTDAVGYALHDRATHYRYLDRWSQVNTWLNDEPPIEGDTVVIPSDQSILIDVPLPKLFLVLIQGFVMFEDYTEQQLNLDATYVLVYGGALIAGTESKPFEGDLTITLHGDRYKDVEIPNFGVKVLAVADKGGLSSSSFAQGAGHEVPLSQKGILDIHGKRRLKTWVNTAATANAGDDFILTEKPVDFAPGETIVITGHVKKFTGAAVSNDKDGDMPPPCFYPSPAEMTTEELIVKDVTDGGTKIILEEPLAYVHQSEIITTGQGKRVSVQAQVALLTRNVIIQGDEGSEEQLFGSHTIAVHGGHFRVENAEVRRCGQAQILGRYCLHYHKTGYNPPPNSYLKSNSIHHSFQRATTIHGTQHALVENNVAYRVMGHNFFVEDGDEEYVVLEGNLGIETLTTPFSLLSDCQAATFWTASPKNIWRNNVAANSHGNGFWFELDGGAAGDFTKAPTIEVSGNNFHDNNMRGWFIAPKYVPETPQYFHDNTYARNHMDGVFYGVGGDTHHVGDNFVSNSGNGDLLWWFFPSRESSRWIPNLKDVTFTGGMYTPGKGARKLPRPAAALFAPNMEFFLVDGAEFTNYEGGSAITQCFDCCGYRSRQGAYTTRFANLYFNNSARRTSYACPQKQIFMDLDGSLTGDKASGVAGDAGASVVAYHAFNEWDECPRADAKFSDGLVCNSSVRVRKLAMPINANVPKVYAPITNAGRQVFLKQSKMIDPLGFVAVFESNRAVEPAGCDLNCINGGKCVMVKSDCSDPNAAYDTPKCDCGAPESGACFYGATCESKIACAAEALGFTAQSCSPFVRTGRSSVQASSVCRATATAPELCTAPPQGGTVKPIERKAILKAVAGFLGLDERHVAETKMPVQAGKSQGFAVQIGGHLDVVSKNDERGRKHVEVSHDGLCNTGAIKADLLAYPGLCVDAYGKQVPFSVAHNKTDLTPEACISWCQDYAQGTGCQHIPGVACRVITAQTLQRGTIDDSFGSAKAVTLWQHGYKSGWEAVFGVGAYRVNDILAHGGKSNDASTIQVKAGYVATVYSNGDLTGGNFYIQRLGYADRYTEGIHIMRRNDALSSLRVENVADKVGVFGGWPSEAVAAKSTCWTMAAVPTHPFVGCFANAGKGGVTNCPQTGGRYEAHTRANHGDVCRNGARLWDCPNHCERMPNDAAPHCVHKGTSSPCRKTGGTGFSKGRTVEQCRAAAKEKGYSLFAMANPVATCNWQCYLDRYEDLQKTYGTDQNRAAAHWRSFGQREGRDCTCTGTPKTADCVILAERPKLARTKATSACASQIDGDGHLLGAEGASSLAIYKTYITSTGGNVREFNLKDYWRKLATVGIQQRPVVCTAPAVVAPVCDNDHVPRAADLATTAADADKFVFQKALSRSSAGFTDVGEKAFNDAFNKSKTQIVVRVCSSCTASHRLIFYKRLTPLPDGWSLRTNLYKSWMSKNNVMGTDFTLHSTYSDALSGANAWKSCNYDDARVGMPRDCGPDRAIGSNWITKSHHKWALYIDLSGTHGSQQQSTLAADFGGQGAGTVCTAPPGVTLKAYAGVKQCKTWGDENTLYDEIDYFAKSWTRETAQAAQLYRRRRDTAGEGAFVLGALGANVCPGGSSHGAFAGVTKEQCEAANAALVPAGKSARRSLVSGRWGHLPLGCSMQTRGDFTAHWNTIMGSNDGVYTPVCTASPPVCVEWRCAKKGYFGQCLKEYCYRAQSGTLKHPTWMTWIKGELPNRDENCITWHCHEPGVSSSACSVFRCTWSSENRKCMEHHPSVSLTISEKDSEVSVGSKDITYTSLPIESAASANDCRAECEKVNCTAFHYLPNHYTDRAACIAGDFCSSSKDRLTWTDVDGDGVADPLCRLSDGTYQARRSTHGCGYAYGASVLQFRSMPTCTLYTTPGYDLGSSIVIPGTSTMDETGNAYADTAPLTGECYFRKATRTRPAGVAKKDAKCFPSLSRPHSETTCRTVVPKMDQYAGVNWHKKGSTGELWNNRDGVDKIFYGPGKNGPNSFDWFGWTIPLVTHHDYIVDWDWHDDFEQFSARWAVPWILQNPDHTASGTNIDAAVPPEARFAGTKSFNPLKDESALVSFAYEDYRFRYKVDKPSQQDVPWFDIHSDDCSRSTCSRRLKNTEKRSRGDITRHDAFGTGMMDRMDESLKTTGTGGEWKIALNPWHGVDMCESRPKPIDFSFTVEARQCPPDVCRLGGYIDYGAKMYWSNLTTWETLAFAEKQDAEASATAVLPAEWGVVEIPEGYHVVLDVDTPVLHKITVYGKLSFLDDHDRELQFENMAVQGNFSIGTKEQPFKHKATISVHGNRSTATLVVSDQHFLGSKTIANFGEIQWHGYTPSVPHAKLERSAMPGDTELHMDTAVDWRVNDTIVITSTDYADNKPTTTTGTYSGNKFVVLPGPDELTSLSEELVIAGVSADGRTVTLNRAVEKRHFAGEVDVGFDKNNVLIETSFEKASAVVSAMRIAYGPAKFTGNASSSADVAAYEGDRTKLHGWYDLEGAPLVDGSSIDACTALPVGTYSSNTLEIVVAYETPKCSAETQAANLLAAGADGLVLVDNVDVDNTIAENKMDLPTMVLGFGDGERALNWTKAAPAGAVTLRAKPVELKASVGNLNRGVVVRGVVQEACTKEQHSANLRTYTNNCQERNMPHHVCKENGFVPHDCYYMKGYGLSITTGELNWGSKDEHEDAQKSGVATRPAKVGQIFAKGVEFVNTGKLSMKHRGFVINYWNKYTKAKANNVIDRCVWRNSWQDGLVTSRANEVTITNNVFHRTLGIGVSTGDEFINWGAGGKRQRKSMTLMGSVPWGSNHRIDGNLVSDSFEYPFGAVDTAATHHWHSGMKLRQDMASFKRNVVAGSYHGGITLRLQDKAYATQHVIDNNEAYANRYGMIVKVHRAGIHELYGFKAWKNDRSGMVSFQEPGSIQLRRNILADNKYGAGVGFLGSNTMRVVDSVVVGVSAATDTSKTCPSHRIGIMLPRYGVNTLCDGIFGPCKECSVQGSAMDERFSNYATGSMEHFYVMDSTFANFGTGQCKDAVGIAINPTEPDYSPDTHLSQLNWLPNVAADSRIRLGDTKHIAPECEKSCDAVDYMRFFDEDGSTIGDVWQDGSPDNFGNTIIMSDINPAVTVAPKCRSDTKTASIVCRNYRQVIVAADIPPLCETCPPVEFITVHKYGAEGPNQISDSSSIKVKPDPALARFGLTNHTYKTSGGKHDGIEGFMAGRIEGAEYNRRTYWSRGAFEMGCSCQKHFMGAGFPVEPGSLIYDIDLPVNPDLNREGEYKPEWMPPNSVFTFKSQDPRECMTTRMWFRDAKPVHVFLNGKSMDSRKLTDGTLPTPTSPAGTNVLDPQSRRLHLTMCGTKGGNAKYTLRVKEAVQVTMAIEMDFEEFFAETKAADDANKNLASLPESLYQRTVGLERLVNNLATLLTIPRNKIKVACVHKIGEPCIPNELTALFGGYNPTRGKRAARDVASSVSVARRAAPTWNVVMDVVPPFSVNETGSDEALANNTAFFDKVTGILETFDEDPTALTQAITANTNVTVGGIGVTKSYGDTANVAKATVLAGDVELDQDVTTTSTTATATTVLGTAAPAPTDAAGATNATAAPADPTVGATNAAAEASDDDDDVVGIAVGVCVAVFFLVIGAAAIFMQQSKAKRRANAQKKRASYAQEALVDLAATPPADAAGGEDAGKPAAPAAVVTLTGPFGRAQVQRDSICELDETSFGISNLAVPSAGLPGSRRVSLTLKDFEASSNEAHLTTV